MRRRTVLKSIALLAAYITLPIKIDAKEKTQIELFQEGFEKGNIENIYFYFTHPIELQIDESLTISNCSFIFDYEGEDKCITITGDGYIAITCCNIQKI